MCMHHCVHEVQVGILVIIDATNYGTGAARKNAQECAGSNEVEICLCDMLADDVPP